MAISITARAQEYIIGKGGIITVRMKNEIVPFNCCGSDEIEVPSVVVGKPSDVETQQYLRVNENTIEVYLHMAISEVFQSEGPFIDLERTMFSKKLVMYGTAM